MPGKNNGRRIAGAVVCLAGAALFCLAGWMYVKTRGTGLLFMDSFTGSLLRYYWAVTAAAAAVTAVGAVLVRKKKEPAAAEEAAEKEETAAVKETAGSGVCSRCGKILKPGAAFCIYCGWKIT